MQFLFIEKSEKYCLFVYLSVCHSLPICLYSLSVSESASQSYQRVRVGSGRVYPRVRVVDPHTLA